METLPFYETGDVRIFSPAVDSQELVWHRDREDRTVTVLQSNNWEFQREDEIPITLSPGDKIKIKAYEWHRIKKGLGNLVIRIEKKIIVTDK